MVVYDLLRRLWCRRGVSLEAAQQQLQRMRQFQSIHDRSLTTAGVPCCDRATGVRLIREDGLPAHCIDGLGS